MAKNGISKLHQQAIDNLQIKDVILMTSSSEISADYEPKYPSSSKSIGVQYKHIVDRSSIISFSTEEEKNVEKLFRVYIELGAKWSYAPDKDKNIENEDINPKVENDVLARIEACFVAEYQLKSEISQEALEEFALKNASYHVWPYWREYLMNHALRMNLPKAVIPMVQFSLDKND